MGALLYRTSDPFDEYGIKLSEFGTKLGVSQADGYALVWYMNLKDDPAAYYCRKTKAGNIPRNVPRRVSTPSLRGDGLPHVIDRGR